MRKKNMMNEIMARDASRRNKYRNIERSGRKNCYGQENKNVETSSFEVKISDKTKNQYLFRWIRSKYVIALVS